jgi:glycosyltransferase involved in cell wall biosynthesis
MAKQAGRTHMNILFHALSPPPRIPGTDAAFQDLEALRDSCGGTILPLFPLPFPSRWIPRPIYGLHRYFELRAREHSCDLHFVAYATGYAFPYLATLRKPICYQVLAGLDPSAPPPPHFRTRIHLIVNNRRDEKLAQKWGMADVRYIRPGIDLTGFEIIPPPPPPKPFVLLAGSAPWTREQFHLKGFDLLFDLLVHHPDLRLILLWRGYQRATLNRLLHRKGLTTRVEVIDSKTDIRTLLARCHATVGLAAHNRLLKAYPHSLLESLAAGRPVIVSETLALADDVRAKQCGEVVGSLTLSALDSAVSSLRRQYDRAAEAATETGREFDRIPMLARFQETFRDYTGKS